MKAVLPFIAVGLLTACDPQAPLPPNPDSIVKKKIVLKDITTAEKPGAVLNAGYRADWSYFGEKRTVQYTLDNAGLVTTIKFKLGSDWDGQQLQHELERKFSEENGKNVTFDCRAESKRIALLEDMAVTETHCTIRSDTQILSLKRIHPKYDGDAQKFPNLRIIYDTTEVLLEDNSLENGRLEAERARSDEDFRKRQEKAKKDI